MPVVESQTRMILSSEPEMILDPSGESATEKMGDNDLHHEIREPIIKEKFV